MGPCFVELEECCTKFPAGARRVVRWRLDRLLAHRYCGGFGGRETRGELLLHRPDPEQILVGVEAQPTGRAAGRQESVAALPST